jgi:hypothetical protein
VFVDLHRNGLVEQVNLNDKPQLAAPFEDRSPKSFHGPARHFDKRSKLKARLWEDGQTGRNQSENAGQIALQLVLGINRDAARDAVRFKSCQAFLRTTIKEHVAWEERQVGTT